MTQPTQTLFQKMLKGSNDPKLLPFFHVPLQQFTLTSPEPDWILTEVEKRIRHSGILFEYLHRRFGQELDDSKPVLLSGDLIEWLRKPAEGDYLLPITNFLWLIANYVSPFDRLHDIKTKKGIEDFYLDIMGKYSIGMDLPVQLLPDAMFENLAQDYPCAQPPQQPVLPLSRGLAHIWREYLKEIPFAPESADARIKFLMRFLIFVQATEIDLRLFSPSLLNYLNAPMFETDIAGVHATGLIYEVLRLAGMGDVQQWTNAAYAGEMTRRFFESAFAALVLPKSIADSHAVLSEKCGVPLKARTYLVGGAKAQKRYILQDEVALPQDHAKAWVNIIETGENNSAYNSITRQLRAVIEKTHVPHTNILPPCKPYVDYIKAHRLENMPWGKINLFSVKLSECADMMLSQGLATVNDRINVGYCTWETNQLPRAQRVALDLLDEIWVPTQYVKDVIGAVTNKPVHVMPYPVTVTPPSPHICRATHGVPDHAFVFVTVMDCFDYMARKNPLATARAFQRAFPDNPNVRLLVKTRNLEHAEAPREFSHRSQLQELAQNDPRIMLFNQSFSDADLSAFINLADCYVSLHRNSAYGRTMMEAMMLGKPVIMTKGTGPADYANEKTAVLVDAVECSVVYDAFKYLDHERGHRWFDPDLMQAAQLMQRVYNDNSYAQSIAQAGQAHIAAHYNPDVTGKKMRARIEALMQMKPGCVA